MNAYEKLVDEFSNLYEQWENQKLPRHSVLTAAAEFLKRLPVGATNATFGLDPFQCRYTLNGQDLYLKASAFGVRFNEPNAYVPPEPRRTRQAILRDKP